MKLKYTVLLIALAGLFFSSCKKQQTVFSDPYAGAKPALGIVTDPQQIPVPASGGAGTQVTITATGLVAHKDELTFLFNGQPGHIDEITATGIKVTVPANASSGITAFVVNGQLIFGPIFNVTGKMNIDPTYENVTGTDNAVFKAFPIPLTTNIMIMGAFTNYDNQGRVRRINRITRTLADGSWDRSFLSGYGANNTVYDMAQVGPYYYIVGAFSSYAQQSNMQGITRIYTNGLVDTTQVTTYLKKTMYVPTFNGAVAGGDINNVYPVGTNKMIVTGNFSFYTSRTYNTNTYDNKDSTVIDSVSVRQIARLNEDGSLDKSWRFDPLAPGYRGRPGKSPDATNGNIHLSVGDGTNILLYGKFSTYDGQPANNITRIAMSNGLLDPTFNAGAGADFDVAYVSYNKVQNKYIVVGNFNNYNGKPSKYMVQLNYDGSIDATFTPKVFDGGVPQFAKLLDDGLVVVNGSFRSYDGVLRNGLAVLDKTGALADGYNNIGNLSGQLYDVLETKSADNKRALLLMGSFYSFDSKPKQNILRVTFQ